MVEVHVDIADVDTSNVTWKWFNIKTRLVSPYKNEMEFAKKMKA